jgi:hypothetical protein
MQAAFFPAMKPGANPASSRLSSPTDRLREAFWEAVDRESKKTAGERMREQALIPFYMLKGASRAALRLLESGLSPLVNGLENSVRQTVSPRQCQVENREKISSLKSFCREAAQNPAGLLDRGIRETANRFAEAAAQFLQAETPQRGEIAGGAAVGLALLFLTRKLPAPLSLGLKLNAAANSKK